MTDLEKLRLDSEWLRDVPGASDPHMLAVAARVEWAVREVEGLREDLEEACLTLRECEAYFEERADAEYGGALGARSNEEMKFLVEVRGILAKHAAVSGEI